MTLLDKTYNPQAIEQHWYQTWEAQQDFAPSHHGEPYCIMLPPPNVTGSLHMGHGFGFTLIDVLIRYQRMCGKNTLWQGGTDHAGIATQMVVERQLNRQGQTRHDIGRETFIEKIWAWKNESGGNITRQLRRLGASIDWSRERFTLEENLSHIVRDIFIRLYEEGLIYRGKRLVNWDPVLLTAISDLEVVHEETEGKLWHIRYPFSDNKNESIVVTTTRPETLLGDVAVAVHPEDARYQHYIGQTVLLPLTERKIPIIADSDVDPEFGTGCVKITPAHDFNDYAIGLRHHLEPINIFTETAHLNENAPSLYQGMERFAARKKIVADLTALHLIEKEEPHKLKIPRGDRSHAVIEPYLTYQWYVKSKPLAEAAIRAVENGDVVFIPENWNKTFFQWMHHIEDWCISRQLWWGHRIPVWYDEEGKTYVGNDEKDVRERHHLDSHIALRQDEDVLDTWFSSALWPFSTLDWPNGKDFKVFFPTNTLITGFDIIFFWVARMIMMSLKFTGQVPFREVYITGLIRDAEGHKMSKSKGNVLDPIDLIDGITLSHLIEKRTYGLMQPEMAKKIQTHTERDYPNGIPSFGTDALRYTFCSFASYTREIRFDMNRLAGYRNFCNKLWNASRYVLMNTENEVDTVTFSNADLTIADRWIQSHLQKTIDEAHQALKVYRFDLFAQILYVFTWDEFCDWYLELTKPILNDKSEKNKYHLAATRHTLLTVLEKLLRLLHPIIPFITEEIWQRVAPLAGKKGKSIMLASYPAIETSLIDEESEKEITYLKNTIIAIRTIRSERNIAPGKLLSVLLRGSHSDQQIIYANLSLLKTLAKVNEVKWLEGRESPPPSASAFFGDTEIFIPFSDFINNEEETARLKKEISKIEKELTFINNKLSNSQFVNHAPGEVVNKERQKQQALNVTWEKLKLQLDQLVQINK